MPKNIVLDDVIIVGFTTQPRDDAEKYIAGLESVQITDAERSRLRLEASATPHLCELESVTIHRLKAEGSRESAYFTRIAQTLPLGPRIAKQMLEWYPLMYNDKTGERESYADAHHIFHCFDHNLFPILVTLECAEQTENKFPRQLFSDLWSQNVMEDILPTEFCKSVPIDLALKRLGIRLSDDLVFAPGLDADEDALALAQIIQKLNLYPYLNKQIAALVEEQLGMATTKTQPKPTAKAAPVSTKKKLKPKKKVAA
jgi:hypothetical protein